MHELTRWRVGGPADVIVEPSSAEETARVIRCLNAAGIPWLAIGHTTNLLVCDAGIRAVVIRIAERMTAMTFRGAEVWAQAGIWVPQFASWVGRCGLSGIEHTIGIPGTLGGLVCMNGGSKRKGIGENITSVTCATPSGAITELDQPACDFRYRSSRIQRDRLIVLEVNFQFTPRERHETCREMLTILRERDKKFPRKLPNCGSVFVSNPAIYAEHGPPGAVIEKCGLKGMTYGGAQISPLHANFIVNTGNANSSDILHLIHIIRDCVGTLLNHDMKCEVRFVDEQGSVRPAHEVKPQTSTCQPINVHLLHNREI